MNRPARKDIAVFLVDDHPMVREGLALMLERRGFTVCGDAESAQAALDHPGLAAASVVVLDISLEQTSGLDVLPLLCQRGKRVVVYSMHEDPVIVKRALAAGATGYVTKREAAPSLADAVAAAGAGQTLVSPRATAALAPPPPGPGLSRQQQQVYDLLGQGWDTDAIASRLELSPRTVEGYCARLVDKLGVDGMKELRRRAIADWQRHPL